MARCNWPKCGKEALVDKIYCNRHIHGGPVMSNFHLNFIESLWKPLILILLLLGLTPVLLGDRVQAQEEQINYDSLFHNSAIAGSEVEFAVSDLKIQFYDNNVPGQENDSGYNFGLSVADRHSVQYEDQFDHFCRHLVEGSNLADNRSKEAQESYLTSYLRSMIEAGFALSEQWALKTLADSQDGLLIELPFNSWWLIQLKYDEDQDREYYSVYCSDNFGYSYSTKADDFVNAIYFMMFSHGVAAQTQIFNLEYEIKPNTINEPVPQEFFGRQK